VVDHRGHRARSGRGRFGRWNDLVVVVVVVVVVDAAENERLRGGGAADSRASAML
jgi:hypothetical protein